MATTSASAAAVEHTPLPVATTASAPAPAPVTSDTATCIDVQDTEQGTSSPAAASSATASATAPTATTTVTAPVTATGAESASAPLPALKTPLAAPPTKRDAMSAMGMGNGVLHGGRRQKQRTSNGVSLSVARAQASYANHPVTMPAFSSLPRHGYDAMSLFSPAASMPISFPFLTPTAVSMDPALSALAAMASTAADPTQTFAMLVAMSTFSGGSGAMDMSIYGAAAAAAYAAAAATTVPAPAPAAAPVPFSPVLAPATPTIPAPVIPEHSAPVIPAPAVSAPATPTTPASEDSPADAAAAGTSDNADSVFEQGSSSYLCAESSPAQCTFPPTVYCLDCYAYRCDSHNTLCHQSMGLPEEENPNFWSRHLRVPVSQAATAHSLRRYCGLVGARRHENAVVAAERAGNLALALTALENFHHWESSRITSSTHRLTHIDAKLQLLEVSIPGLILTAQMSLTHDEAFRAGVILALRGAADREKAELLNEREAERITSEEVSIALSTEYKEAKLRLKKLQRQEERARRKQEWARLEEQRRTERAKVLSEECKQAATRICDIEESMMAKNATQSAAAIFAAMSASSAAADSAAAAAESSSVAAAEPTSASPAPDLPSLVAAALSASTMPVPPVPSNSAAAPAMPARMASLLASLTPELAAHLQRFIGADLPLSDAKLIYDASLHGWRAQDFWLRCEGIPRTMMLLRVGPTHLFGALAYPAWPRSSVGTIGDPSGRTCLFSLQNDHSRPVRLRMRNVAHALWRRSDHGPGFGHGGGDFLDLRLMCHKRPANDSRGVSVCRLSYEIDQEAEEAAGLPPVRFTLDKTTLAGSHGRGDFKHELCGADALEVYTL